MENEPKRVSWLELFYDLAFVALIAQLTYVVADRHETLFDLMTIGLVGYMIFIAWTGTMVNRNLRSSETSKERIIVQFQTVLAFLMSVTLPGVFDGNYAPFFFTFAAIRASQAFMFYHYYMTHPQDAPKTWNMLQGVMVGSLVWVAAGFAPLPFAFVLAFAALAIDILTPLTQGRGNTPRMLNVHHLQERLGLFLILVMGESMLVVALANTAVDLAVFQPVIVLSGIILMIAIWWTYFDHLEMCGEGHRPGNLLAYMHAHGFFFGGIVLLAAAYKNFLKHDYFVTTDYLLLVAGLTVCAITMTIIRSKITDEVVMRTGAVRAMMIGTPLVGYAGYYFQDKLFAIVLITLWAALLAAYDVKRRRMQSLAGR